MYSDENFNNEENYNNEDQGINQSYDDSVENNNDGNDNSNKKKLWIVIGVVVLLVLVVVFFMMNKGSSDNNDSSRPILVISTAQEVLALNNSIPLVATVSNYRNSKITWSSSNPEIASVDSNGIVYGNQYGTAIITASYVHTDGQTYSIDCSITVADGNPAIPITDVSFQEGEVIITVGDEFKLPTIVTPSDGYISNIKYETSDLEIVTVDATGKIKANSEGSATITVDFNSGQFDDEIVVNVVKESITAQIFIPATSITFNYDEKMLKMNAGKVQQLNYSVEPENAYLIWESSDPNVATVSDGIVTALSTGSTTITVKTLDGKSDSLSLEVVDNTIVVDEIKITSGTKVNLNVGKTSQITANITPADSNKTISYVSNNESVATVNANGLITAKSVGTATITLTIVNKIENTNNESNIITATITVDVTSGSSNNSVSTGSSRKYIKSITQSDKTVDAGNIFNVTPVIEPTNATNKKIRCESDNTEVVQVLGNGDSSCAMVAKKRGTAKITITAQDGSNVEKEFNITVNGASEQAKVRTINLSDVTINKTGSSVTKTVTPQILPTNATVKKVRCTIKDSDIATVSTINEATACSITPVSDGTTNLTVVALDGSGVSKTVRVTVSGFNKRVTAINLSNVEINGIGRTFMETITPVILPANATVKKIRCSIRDNDIATVVTTSAFTACNITPLKDGETTLTIEALDGSGISKTVNVVVSSNSGGKKVTGITQSDKTVSAGVIFSVSPTIVPSDATNKKIRCESSATDIVQVLGYDTTCSMIGKRAGTAKITITAQDGSNVHTDFDVTVTGTSEQKKVTSINLSDVVINGIGVVSIKTVTPEVLPTDATVKKISCSIIDKSVALVSTVNEGTACKITPVKVGRTDLIIRALDGSGISKTVNVTVNTSSTSGTAVESVTISPTTYNLEVNKSIRLTPTINPSTASNKVIRCESDNNLVSFEYFNEGKACIVKAGSIPGTSIVTISSNNGKTVTVTVNIIKKVSSISYNKDIRVGVSKSLIIAPTIDPSNASNKTIKCSSSNSNITVKTSSSGLSCTIEGETVGNAILTIESTDGSNVVLQKNVEIYNYIKSFSVSQTKINVHQDRSVNLTVSDFKDVNGQSVTGEISSCLSNNSAVFTAEVSSDKQSCVVSGVSVGNANLTVKIKDGSTKSIPVYVEANNYIESFSVSHTNINVHRDRSVNLTVSDFKDGNGQSVTGEISSCVSTNRAVFTAEVSSDKQSCVVRGEDGGTRIVPVMVFYNNWELVDVDYYGYYDDMDDQDFDQYCYTCDDDERYETSFTGKYGFKIDYSGCGNLASHQGILVTTWTSGSLSNSGYGPYSTYEEALAAKNDYINNLDADGSAAPYYGCTFSYSNKSINGSGVHKLYVVKKYELTQIVE